MKRMLERKLPISIICWSLIVGMVLFSTPAFSKDRSSPHDRDRTHDRDIGYDQDRDRDRGRDYDRSRAHDRNKNRSVRVVHKSNVLPAIIATGLIAGITFSLLDNDNAVAPQVTIPQTCPAGVGFGVAHSSVVVTAALLNIRSGPGLHNHCVGQIHRGATLSIIGTSAGWYNVRTSGGVNGWVMAQYTSPMAYSGNG